MDEHEAIASPMVTKAMARAQKKLMKKKPLVAKIDSRELMLNHLMSKN